jgi:hypothetical protein
MPRLAHSVRGATICREGCPFEQEPLEQSVSSNEWSFRAHEYPSYPIIAFAALCGLKLPEASAPLSERNRPIRSPA